MRAGERFLGLVDPQHYIGLSYVLRCLRSGATAMAPGADAGMAGTLRALAEHGVNYVSAAPDLMLSREPAHGCAAGASGVARRQRRGHATRRPQAFNHLTPNIYDTHERSHHPVARPPTARDPAPRRHCRCA